MTNIEILEKIAAGELTVEEAIAILTGERDSTTDEDAEPEAYSDIEFLGNGCQ